MISDIIHFSLCKHLQILPCATTKATFKAFSTPDESCIMVSILDAL